MSVFGSKAGAVCNLAVSPEYVNVSCPAPAAVVELPVLAGCSSVHGTATCFVPPAVALADELAVPEVCEEVPVVPEEGVLELVELVDPPSERIAKSTFPEFGLIMTSLIVPTDSPDEDFTSALVNWLARTSCCVRPVAARPLMRSHVEGLDESSEDLFSPVSGDVLVSVEVPECNCARTPSVKHAAQNAAINKCFLIPAFR